MYDDNDRKDYPNYSVNNNSEDENRERNAGMYSGSRYDYTNRTGQSSFTTGQTAGNTVNDGFNSGVKMRLNRAIPDEPVKKKKGGFAGKFFATIALGILFGLTVGATLFVMNQVHESKLFSKADSAIEEGVDNIKGLIGVEEAAEAVPETVVPDAVSSTEPAVQVASPDSASGQIVAFDVSGIAEDVMPSVVSIIGNYTVTSQNFFGQTFSQETEGSGSGIIIGQDDKTLIIATNNHVVEDSTALKIQFIDGTTAEARIKGTDADIDLAVVIVDLDEIAADTKNKIKVARLGDSEALKVGEPAIVIGNALGYGQSVTAGVISAVNRSVPNNSNGYAEQAEIEGLIQTDAAINPGNSGGALVNSKGEVVGISSSKISGSSVDSMGFAIPISRAEPILSDIVTSADRVKVSDSKAGYLGIGGVTVTSDVSQMYAIPVGVVVRQVYEGTGASAAGMLPGDVIKSIDGKDISSMEELRAELEYHEAGTYVKVGIYRYEQGEYNEMTLDISLVDKKTLDKAE